MKKMLYLLTFVVLLLSFVGCAVDPFGRYSVNEIESVETVDASTSTEWSTIKILDLDERNLFVEKIQNLDFRTIFDYRRNTNEKIQIKKI